MEHDAVFEMLSLKHVVFETFNKGVKMFFTKRLGMLAVVVAAVCGMTASTALADAVYGWGEYHSGQLGGDIPRNPNSPVALTGSISSGVTTVSAGVSHSLALRNGGVWAWGNNGSGQLGNGTLGTYEPALTPIALTGAMSSGVTAIVASGFRSLAIKDGGIWMWGITGSDLSLTPTALSGPMSSGVTAIAAGDEHNLAIKDGGVWAWGSNRLGQLGDGTTIDRNLPVAVDGLSSGVTAIAGGYGHSLAIKDGGVWAWGWNFSGQLGYVPTSPDQGNSPVALTGSMSSGVSAIAAGRFHSLALKEDGSVWAWGYGFDGELGTGDLWEPFTPMQVDPTNLYDIVAIAAGAYSSYALSADGSLWVWGDNEYGQLGLGVTGGQYNTPQHLLPPDGYRFTSISANCLGYHALATLAPVPEPTSLSILAIGAAGLLMRRRHSPLC